VTALAAAAVTLAQMVEPVGSVPRAALDAAFCVGVFTGGSGVITCGTEGGPGPWGPPLLMRRRGPAHRKDAPDALLLVRHPDAVDGLLAASGPRRESPGAYEGPPVVVYVREGGSSRSAGPEAVVAEPDGAGNRALYQRAIAPRDIVLRPGLAVPAAARELHDLLMRLSPGGGTAW